MKIALALHLLRARHAATADAIASLLKSHTRNTKTHFSLCGLSRYTCVLSVYTYIYICVCMCIYIHIHTHIYVHNFISALITHECRAINNRDRPSFSPPLPFFLPPSFSLPGVEEKKDITTRRYFGAYASLVSFAIEYRLDFVLDLRVTGHLMKTEPRARARARLGSFNSSHLPVSRSPRGGERSENFTSITCQKL